MDNSRRRRGRPTGEAQLDREVILRKALKAFARFGFDGVKLSKLAGSIGVANSLLNYHFDGKEELWKESMQFAHQQLEEKFKNVYRNFKDLDGVSMLKVLTRQAVYFAAEFPEYFEAFALELRSKTARADWLVDELVHPMNERITQNFQNQIETGKIKDLPTVNILMMITGAAQMIFFYDRILKRQYNTDIFDPEEIERYADGLVEVMFNGIIQSNNKI
ncbi:MAG: TetR/AcrR family transcriptional regulator [Bacteroidota bacterium]